jgi:hypothetical protein
MNESEPKADKQEDHEPSEPAVEASSKINEWPVYGNLTDRERNALLEKRKNRAFFERPAQPNDDDPEKTG